MLGAGEFLQQSWIRSCCASQGRYGRRGLEDAGPARKTDRGCHLTSLGRRAELADIQTLAKYHVQEILGSGRCMSKSRQLGPEGSERGTWRSYRLVGAGVGLLRRSLQRQEIRVSATIWQLCYGKRSFQSLIPWYMHSSLFSSHQR